MKNAATMVFLCLVCVAVAAAAATRNHKSSASAGGPNKATTPADSASVAAFEAMVAVLRNPRCINCHSTGDFPRQGDDGHPHGMNVRRGPDGKGLTAGKCSTCHQDHNLGEEHLPPGAPNWRSPPASMPMIWQGLTDREICEQLRDPARNGHRSLQAIVEHVSGDELVAWGWNPGPGRAPVPMPKDEFVAQVKTWVAGGAACPAK